jgi:hypothetical protein
MIGQSFATCCFSATHISGPKSLKVVVNTKKMFSSKTEHLFGAATCVAEIRQASKICPIVFLLLSGLRKLLSKEEGSMDIQLLNWRYDYRHNDAQHND